MARKCAYTKEMILEAAIKLFKKEGSDAITAKNIAKELGCSVAPIYSVYLSLDDLKKDLALEFKKNILKKDSKMNIFSQFSEFISLIYQTKKTKFSKLKILEIIAKHKKYITEFKNNKSE